MLYDRYGKKIIPLTPPPSEGTPMCYESKLDTWCMNIFVGVIASIGFTAILSVILYITEVIK